jgi:hypothetical protein
VELRQSCVFGKFADKRPKPTFEVNDKRVLILTGDFVFSGGEIQATSGLKLPTPPSLNP